MRPPTAKWYQYILLGPKRTGHLKRQRLVARLDRAGRLHHVLRLQRGEESRAIDTQAGELLHRELDEYLLVLSAQDFDLRDVAHVQELRTDVLDVIAKLAMGESIGVKP
jgi:hypothetical protein